MTTATMNQKDDFIYLLEKVNSNPRLKELFSGLSMDERNLFLYFACADGKSKAIGDEFNMKPHSITKKCSIIREKLKDKIQYHDLLNNI